MTNDVYWTPLAKDSFIELAVNIEKEWGTDVLTQFEFLTDKRVTQIISNPKLAPQIHESGLRKLVIHKNVSIFYDLKPNLIRILLVWDNRMSPSVLKRKLKL